MSVHDFSIASDFPSGLDVAAFTDELLYDYEFENLSGIETSSDLCRVTFSVDLTSEQIDSLNVAVAAHDGQPKPFVKKHYEQEYVSSRLVRETWWARAAGDVLSLKVEETTYTHSGNRLMTEQWKSYARDGSVLATRTWNFRQEKIGTTLRVRKVEQ